MLYRKPPGMTYTAMAIAIDKGIRDPDADKELLFEYMWHLFYILAVKGRFFTSGRDYDEYALYAATQLFLRYKKEEAGTSKRIKPIKSCLNYIKKVLYPMKVNYQKTYFEQVIRNEDAKEDNYAQLQEDRENMARKSASELMHIEYEQYLESIPRTIKFVLKTSPYQKDKVMMHNIYISCLLTLLKTVTISNYNKERLKKRTDRVLPVENLIDQIYAEEMSDNTVLYHLDSTMGNYISTLVARIRKEIIKDLRDIVGSFEPSEQVIKDILKSPIEEYVDSNE